jgi:hypothetical protein
MSFGTNELRFYGSRVSPATRIPQKRVAVLRSEYAKRRVFPPYDARRHIGVIGGFL